VFKTLQIKHNMCFGSAMVYEACCTVLHMCSVATCDSAKGTAQVPTNLCFLGSMLRIVRPLTQPAQLERPLLLTFTLAQTQLYLDHQKRKKSGYGVCGIQSTHGGSFLHEIQASAVACTAAPAVITDTYIERHHTATTRTGPQHLGYQNYKDIREVNSRRDQDSH
jgi:hypothetical protein